jgi:hypothetical protein
MNQEQRYELISQIPKMFEISEHDNGLGSIPAVYADWAKALGHPLNEEGTFCQACGLGAKCLLQSFYHAMIASVVRELDGLGRLAPQGVTVVRKTPSKLLTSSSDLDRELNDPFGLWGEHPSYRCYVGRHRDCEPEGAEQGCTCSCGHQKPVCACNSREVDWDGNLMHYLGCPRAER